MRTALALVLAAGALLAPQAPPRSGIDLSALDRSVRPQDDLYRFANGKWLDTAVIPADRVTWGALAELAEQADVDVRRIIESLEGRSGPERRLRDLYTSMTDEATIESRGGTPIKVELARIDALDSTADLARQIGRLSAMNAGGPFGSSAGIDGANPTALIVTVAQGGTLLPERDYYLRADPACSHPRAVPRISHRRSSVAGRTAPADRRAPSSHSRLDWLERSSLMPTRQIRVHGTPIKCRRRCARWPGFDGQAWAKPGVRSRERAFSSSSRVLRTFAGEVNTTPLATWKAWLAARYITASSIFVSNAFADARFEFFGRVLSGQQAPRERWKRGVSMVNGYLGDEMGQLYVKKHLPDSSRDRVRKMVDTIVRSFREAIDQSEWMTPEARGAAREKLRLSVAGGSPTRGNTAVCGSPRRLLGNAAAPRVRQRNNMRLLRRRSAGGEGEPPQTSKAYSCRAERDRLPPRCSSATIRSGRGGRGQYGGIGATRDRSVMR